MKHFYTSVMLLCSIAVCHAEAVTQQRGRAINPTEALSGNPILVENDLLDLPGVRTISQAQHPNTPFAVKKADTPAPARITAQEAPVFRANGGSDKIYGYVAGDPGYQLETGIYSFSMTDGSRKFLQYNISATHGGVSDGITYYASQLDLWGTYIMGVSHAKVDVETWKNIQSYPGDENELSGTGTCMTYDPTTGNVYGCFWNSNGKGFHYGILNTNNFTSSTICALETTWVACGVDSNGNLYAVDGDAKLHSVDKATGAMTLIGDTALPFKYTCGGAFDLATDIFYVTVSNDEEGALYTVDIATAAATKCFDFPKNAEVTGLYIPAPPAKSGAPAAVETVEAKFEGNSLEGNLVFDVPTTTYDGNNASGNVTYTITANNNTIATGTAAHGETVTCPVTVETAGAYVFGVSLANEVGSSPIKNIEKYVGDDIPLAVENVNATYSETDQAFTITWDAVTKGEHDGFVDSEKVVYEITRALANTVPPTTTIVAEAVSGTTYTDPFPTPDNLEPYFYKVRAKYAGHEALATSSNLVALGNIVPPYTEDFTVANMFKCYTTIDNNNDNRTWKYNYDGWCSIGSSSDFTLKMDDWLITPPIKLEAGKIYDFSVDARTKVGGSNEKIEVFMGKAPTVEAMTERLADETNLIEVMTVTLSKRLAITETGKYYIGIHGCSEPEQLYLYVSNLRITEGITYTTPAAITDAMPIATTLRENDGDVTITFTAPSKNLAGEPLESLDRIVIERDNGEPVTTIETVTPGAPMSYVDNGVSTGAHTYTLTAYNTYGKGESAQAKAFVGISVPGAPVDIRLTEEGNTGKVKLAWNAPVYDADNYPINPALCTYTVVNPLTSEVIQENLTDTEIEFPAVAEGEQAYVYYAVKAKTQAGEGEAAYSAIIPVGAPYALPLVESFPNAKSTYAWAVSGTMGEWRLFDNKASTIEDADGTNGFIGYYNPKQNEYSTFVSGKITLANAVQPGITLAYNNFAENDDNTIDISIISDGTSQKIKTITMNEGLPEAWNTAVAIVPAEYIGKIIQVAITATTHRYAYTMIDKIQVMELPDVEYVALEITAPAEVEPGQKFNVDVKVSNEGLKGDAPYTVSLFANGEKVDTKDFDGLVTSTITTISFEQTLSLMAADDTEYYAVVEAAGDANADNNTTETVSTFLRTNPYPVPQHGAAQGDEAGVTLTWSEPDPATAPKKASTDDFESYESFITDNIGDWTLIDEDDLAVNAIPGLTVPCITNGQTKLAYFVLDFNGISGNENTVSKFTAHSGTKYLATSYINGKTSSDWLISPLLSGQAQTISFYARSANGSFPESFEFMYSTTGKEIADFELMETKANIAGAWTEYSFNVPAGTTYFAIHCISTDKVSFQVDDVTFVAANGAPMDLNFIGYNVYRNGEKINAEPVTDTTFADATGKASDKYGITAVYEEGESKAAIVDVTQGVDDAAAASVVISVTNRVITVTGAEGKAINVYSIDGKTIFSGTGQARTTINVINGVYVVKAANKVEKVIVR